MFTSFHAMIPSDAELTSQALTEEGNYRFPSFSASDAVMLGLSLPKPFPASSRHSKGKGLIISIQTVMGHMLFACTVGDLGHPAGVGDVSLDSWTSVDSMIGVMRQTGHSSYYVEKSMSAMGKSAKQLGIQGDYIIHGGAFPIWLDNAHCCPIAVVACYSGSTQEDHHLVVTTVWDYLHKINKSEGAQMSASSALGTEMHASLPSVPIQESTVSSYQ
ncbi:uncharacterized protein F5891DRAFT_1255087 [Suillus fuscotomentosus]|uniref:Uncharacterized protein n=1 Tax=Suillus fuscotomentosus TaxID=1912939 RepID=A0AAD4DW20_9AGAM|nr:uncharacterized protein F5891DRAFT_1255087 [Suillus fuscotomentosus]KAG1894571.1 hypothetical protein F5891DRAFT_1255087 [Suillus fuscotomentosus]